MTLNFTHGTNELERKAHPYQVMASGSDLSKEKTLNQNFGGIVMGLFLIDFVMKML